MIERHLVGCKPVDEEDQHLICSGTCSLRSWKSFLRISGITVTKDKYFEVPLVEITTALHNSIVHQDYDMIENMNFPREDLTYKKLLEAIREGKEFCPEVEGLN